MLQVIEPQPKLIIRKGELIGRLLDSNLPALPSKRDRNLLSLDSRKNNLGKDSVRHWSGAISLSVLLAGRGEEAMGAGERAFSRRRDKTG